MEFIGHPDRTMSNEEPPIYAASCRWVTHGARARFGLAPGELWRNIRKFEEVVSLPAQFVSDQYWNAELDHDE